MYRGDGESEMNINRRGFLISLLAAPFIPKVEIVSKVPVSLCGIAYHQSVDVGQWLGISRKFYGGAAGGGKSYLMNKMMEDYYKHMLRKSNEALY